MLVDEFDFILPRSSIAVSPAIPRESAKLLCVSGSFSDKRISDFPSILQKGDLLVFNDTKVIPARVHGKRGEAKVEVTLHKNMDSKTWKAFAKPAKKLKIGDIFLISSDFSAQVTAKDEGEVTLVFNVSGEEFYNLLNQYGMPPLPPYIERRDGVQKSDIADYQTVYAKNRGAVAAPTAGLHFTDEILDKIRAVGADVAFTTLHVGAGTFLPVKVVDTKDHKMHSEYCVLSRDVAEKVNKTKESGGRVIAIGTTSLRVLESAADKVGHINPFEGETDIFITPGYRFKIVDKLLTNFHLPRSTLFMLVCAFAGTQRMKDAYQHAIENNYRFYSYGDACFL